MPGRNSRRRGVAVEHHLIRPSLRPEPLKLRLSNRLAGGLPFLGLVIAATILWGIACGDDEGANTRGVPGGSGAQTTKSSRSGANDTKNNKVGENERPQEPIPAAKERELPEASFIETDENRDPFRSYLSVFAA